MLIIIQRGIVTVVHFFWKEFYVSNQPTNQPECTTILTACKRQYFYERKKVFHCNEPTNYVMMNMNTRNVRTQSKCSELVCVQCDNTFCMIYILYGYHSSVSLARLNKLNWSGNTSLIF